MSIINRIVSIQFDRHPIAGNKIAFIQLDDGSQMEAFRQGGGLDFWACRSRSKMSREEQEKFDQYLDREWRIQDEEGL